MGWLEPPAFSEKFPTTNAGDTLPRAAAKLEGRDERKSAVVQTRYGMLCLEKRGMISQGQNKLVPYYYLGTRGENTLITF